MNKPNREGQTENFQNIRFPHGELTKTPRWKFGRSTINFLLLYWHAKLCILTDPGLFGSIYKAKNPLYHITLHFVSSYTVTADLLIYEATMLHRSNFVGLTEVKIYMYHRQVWESLQVVSWCLLVRGDSVVVLCFHLTDITLIRQILITYR